MAFGWVLDPEPHKDPKTILARIIHSIARDKISDTLLGLIADCNDLLHPIVLEHLTDEETEFATQACTVINHFRGKHRVAKSGWTTGKSGSIRRYSTENLGLIAF